MTIRLAEHLPLKRSRTEERIPSRLPTAKERIAAGGAKHVCDTQCRIAVLKAMTLHAATGFPDPSGLPAQVKEECGDRFPAYELNPWEEALVFWKILAGCQS